MSKEWYLDNVPPQAVGGYESDVISEYAQSNFTDVLLTTFSNTVLLYNNNLTESAEVKCIVQGNTGDSQESSLRRTMLFPIGTVKAGMYVYFQNCYWIIDGYPGNNKAYEKATLKLCQYNLTWQLSNGEIRNRWVHIDTASNLGEKSNNIITITSGRYTILIGHDEDAMELEGKRVFIDKNESMPTKVYKLTSNNDVSMDYHEHGSVLSFIADKTELDLSRDNQELRVCNYFSPTVEPPVQDEFESVNARIDGKSELKIWFPRKYYVTFTDKDGAELFDVDFKWNIVSEFDVTNIVNETEIEICVDVESGIGKSFKLQVLDDENNVMSEMTIFVTEGF